MLLEDGTCQAIPVTWCVLALGLGEDDDGEDDDCLRVKKRANTQTFHKKCRRDGLELCAVQVTVDHALT